MVRPSVLLLVLAFAPAAFAQTTRADVLKAIADETRAIEKNPADAGAYLERALAYEAAGRDLEAIEDLSELIKINGKSSDAFERRATLYFRMGEFARADSDYAAAVFLDRHNAAALYGRGMTQRLDRFNPAGAADENIAAAIAIQPDIAEKMAARGVK